jgi:CHAD domain-containing protein
MRSAVPPSDLLKPRVDRFTRVLRGLEQGDVKALHRTRVASRRLRELIPVLQLPPDLAKKLSRRLRKVTERLGSARELDVTLLLIDELHTSRPVHQDALEQIRRLVAKERDAVRKKLVERLPIEDLQRLARKLDRVRSALKRDEEVSVAERKPSRAKAARWATDARVAQRAAKLTEAIVGAGAVYLPERLHDVRIALKKLRYVLEIAAEIAREKQTPTLRTLKRAQELLGRMHDVEVLIARVRDAQASPNPPSLAAWRQLDALVTTLEDICRRLHARYVRERDGLDAIAARLSQRSASGARVDRRAERRADHREGHREGRGDGRGEDRRAG